jgi:arylsulfatase A-like enzyme
MNRRRTLVAVSAVVLAAVIIVGWLRLRPHHRGAPNVILISVDTLRPDHLGCYGYGKNTSPAIDEFARDAVLFENCFSQASTTRPSVASFLSGFFPHECKVVFNSDNLPPEVTTIAERLKAKGYITLAASSNFVLGPGSGYDQGFDVFDNKLDDLELVRRVPERVASHTTDAAIDLLKSASRDTFFLWVHYQDPHGPYTPPPPFNTAFLDRSRPPEKLRFTFTFSGIGGIPSYQRLGNEDDYGFYVSQYDGEIGYLDKHVGRLLKALKNLGLYDNSLIILTADHGEGMGEHNYYFAHGEFVYNSLERVPLIVRSGLPAAARRSEYAELLDIVPTILRHAGVEPGSEFRGRNLLGAALKPTPIFCEMDGRYSVIDHGIKLIEHADEGRIMLFDLSRDMGEEHDLIADPAYARYIEPMRAEIEDFLNQDLIKNAVPVPASLSDQDREKLKSLGYTH